MVTLKFLTKQLWFQKDIAYASKDAKRRYVLFNMYLYGIHSHPLLWKGCEKTLFP